MRYLINVVHDGPIDPDTVKPETFEAMGGFVAKLAADGILVDAAGLEPVEQATRVDLHDGQIKLLDGPFAEAKEWIGGYFIIQVRDQDEAVEYARQSVEIHRVHAPGMNVIHEVRRIVDEE
ncbi:YciI family protein [Glycomyces buryatensis]|uniref:Transcriptional regulator n=1 Tax=Glycomyces buryatensis TaxID=2570927 RepID=A0A4S8Q9L1_9ACTN|nr:YciI family protein [Glycomyces buryatensis]THV39472.1 transcriptional regulator [Glycomyces buryatensis]